MTGVRNIVILLLVVGISAFLLTSCGEEKGAGPKCSNCDFWSKAFGGSGHDPAASPVAGSHLVAYTSTQTPTGAAGTYTHVWVAKLAAGSADTTRFYEITTGDVYDAKPAWSPDGLTIAFERQTGNISEIYTVGVSDLESPETPIQFTAPTTDYNSFTSPGWVVVGQDTFIVFAGGSKGGGDYDVLVQRYPGGSGIVQATRDPFDYAKDENGVLGLTFKDEETAADGGNLVAFVSPDRVAVGDIEVKARSVEKPDTTETADIWINSKDTGQSTPHIFRYRPAGTKYEFRGVLARYCTQPFDSAMAEPGNLTTVVLDFIYVQGTVALSSNPGVRLIYFDGHLLEERTKGSPTDYVYLDCINPGTHTAYAANVTNGVQCSPTYTFQVTPGDTSWVPMDCTGGGLVQSLAPAAGRQLAVASAAFQPSGGPNGLWVMDLPGTGPLTDGQLYLVDSSTDLIVEPTISPDGRYVAYIRGSGRTREIVVSDIQGLLAGGPPAEPITIGMPGSLEDIECWRIPERLSWLPDPAARKLVASISVCRGGAADDFEIWIADLSRFIQ